MEGRGQHLATLRDADLSYMKGQFRSFYSLTRNQQLSFGLTTLQNQHSVTVLTVGGRREQGNFPPPLITPRQITLG